jgi:hypothetical protein
MSDHHFVWGALGRLSSNLFKWLELRIRHQTISAFAQTFGLVQKINYSYPLYVVKLIVFQATIVQGCRPSIIIYCLPHHLGLVINKHLVVVGRAVIPSLLLNLGEDHASVLGELGLGIVLEGVITWQLW